MSIDLGMFYATCASTDSSGNVALLIPEGSTRSQVRLAIANSDPLIFGDAAVQLRETNPGSVQHCLQLFIGQSKIDQTIHDRQCPAEVLMAMLLRKLVEQCWTERGMPEAVAITVPTTYNQFYRQSILQAARIAGMKSVRLIDRSMAILQARKFDSTWSVDLNQPIAHRAEHDAPQVIISITASPPTWWLPEIAVDGCSSWPVSVVGITVSCNGSNGWSIWLLSSVQQLRALILGTSCKLRSACRSPANARCPSSCCLKM